MIQENLPGLDDIVNRVVGAHLVQQSSPLHLSTEAVRRFHVEVNVGYWSLGRKDLIAHGAIKKAVRRYLEREYAYVEEREPNPLKPERMMIVGAHYQKR